MKKAIAFLKTKLGKVVLGILALLATLTATGLDDQAIQLLSEFVANQPAIESE